MNSQKLEAKITKQMRNLIEEQLKQNKTPDQAIESISFFTEDFSDEEMYLIKQYAIYLKNLIDSNSITNNSWERFISRVKAKTAERKLDKAENRMDEKALKARLNELDEYDKLSRLLRDEKPVNKKQHIEQVSVVNNNSQDIFDPFDEEAAKQLSDISTFENEREDFTLNSDEFKDDFNSQNIKLDSFERNIEFDDDENVEEMKEEFSKIKQSMQDKIDDLTSQVEELKLKLANYGQDDSSTSYDIIDESDDELAAQEADPRQQGFDFAITHNQDELAKDIELKKKRENKPHQVYGFDALVKDDDGNEYHVVGSKKDDEDKTIYLVRDENDNTLTFKENELNKDNK